MLTDAYEAGRLARFDGEGIDANPYAQPEARWQWLKGWRDADDEMKG